jgi:hypothetical protein
MRRLSILVALAGLLVLGACSGSDSLTGPAAAGPQPALQDGVDPGSNNHHDVVRLLDTGVDPGSNNGQCGTKC